MWGVTSRDAMLHGQVELQSVKVDVALHHVRAHVHIVQRYINHSTKAIPEASYRSPMDANAVLRSCLIEIDNIKIKTALQELTDAKKMFETAVQAGKKAGLLQQHVPDVFELSLGNVPAGATCVVNLEYDMRLEQVAGGTGETVFTLPAAIAPRYHDSSHAVVATTTAAAITATAEARFVAAIHVSMPSSIVDICSPTHDAGQHGKYMLTRKSDTEQTVHLSQPHAWLPGDLKLVVRQLTPFETRASIQWSPKLNEYMMEILVAMPSLPADALMNTAAHSALEFWIDCSGSMQGERIQGVRDATHGFLASMNEAYRFTLRKFGTRDESWEEQPVPYTDESLASARLWVDALVADMNGTELLSMIRNSLSKPMDTTYPPQVVLLTDGAVSNPDDVIRAARKGVCRIHTFGIGSGASQHLVEGVARVTGGHMQMIPVCTPEEIGKAVTKVIGTLFQPAYTTVSVSFPDAKVDAKVDAIRLDAKSVFETLPNVDTKVVDAASTPATGILEDGKTEKLDEKKPARVAATSSVVMWPAARRAMFAGCVYPLYVRMPAGAGSTASPTRIVLELGTNVRGEPPRKLTLDLTPAPDGDLLHRLAAKARLQELQDKEENVIDREEIVRVSIRYGVQSSLTAFVGVEEGKLQSAISQTLVHPVSLSSSAPTSLSLSAPVLPYGHTRQHQQQSNIALAQSMMAQLSVSNPTLAQNHQHDVLRAQHQAQQVQLLTQYQIQYQNQQRARQQYQQLQAHQLSLPSVQHQQQQQQQLHVSALHRQPLTAQQLAQPSPFALSLPLGIVPDGSQTMQLSSGPTVNPTALRVAEAYRNQHLQQQSALLQMAATSQPKIQAFQHSLGPSVAPLQTLSLPQSGGANTSLVSLTAPTVTPPTAEQPTVMAPPTVASLLRLQNANGSWTWKQSLLAMLPTDLVGKVPTKLAPGSWAWIESLLAISTSNMPSTTVVTMTENKKVVDPFLQNLVTEMIRKNGNTSALDPSEPHYYLATYVVRILLHTLFKKQHQRWIFADDKAARWMNTVATTTTAAINATTTPKSAIVSA